MSRVSVFSVASTLVSAASLCFAACSLQPRPPANPLEPMQYRLQIRSDTYWEARLTVDGSALASCPAGSGRRPTGRMAR